MLSHERFSRVANELAGLLSSNDSARQLELLRQIAGWSRPRTPVQGAPGPRRVGIWEERQRGNQTLFIRAAGHEPWHLWADEARIGPKRPNTRRVVLIGESVARGFFYDPV